MTSKGYDVLRLIEHGQHCYISSEYVEGRVLAGWLRANPDVTKEQLFSLIREITNQLGMIHKCRKKPYYQYVNPYSIVVTEEGKLYFLDMEAGSNEKQLRFMQRRAVRESFLPEEVPCYQKASTELDIYGLGKTIQYLLAVSKPDPPLNRREERRFLRILSKCLKNPSKSSCQSVAEIRRHLPQYKHKPGQRAVSLKKLLMVGAAVVVLLIAWKLRDSGSAGAYQPEEEDLFAEQEIRKPEQLSEQMPEQTLSDSGEDYMELAFAYIDMGDYEKALHYLEKLREDYAPAGYLKEIVEAFLGIQKEPQVLEEALSGLEEAMSGLEEVSSDLEEGSEGERRGQYVRCLIKGYGLLDTQQSAEAILRLGRSYADMPEVGEEEKREVREYMASACERLGDYVGAVQVYEEILGQEAEAVRREEVYRKMIAMYEACGQMDMAMNTCIRGIEEQSDSEGLKITHIRLLCQDAAIGRDLCARTIQEYVRQTPGIMEKEEFQGLAKEYEIRMEGDQVWVGR